MTGRAGVSTLCSAVQNYHRCTVLLQTLYCSALLCFFQSFQRWDLSVKGTVAAAACLFTCLAKGAAGAGMVCDPTFALHLAAQ